MSAPSQQPSITRFDTIQARSCDIAHTEKPGCIEKHPGLFHCAAIPLSSMVTLLCSLQSNVQFSPSLSLCTESLSRCQ
jgi:hypothetical protein